MCDENFSQHCGIQELRHGSVPKLEPGIVVAFPARLQTSVEIEWTIGETVLLSFPRFRTSSTMYNKEEVVDSQTARYLAVRFGAQGP